VWWLKPIILLRNQRQEYEDLRPAQAKVILTLSQKQAKLSSTLAFPAERGRDRRIMVKVRPT
jgi:hypothetical protein